MRVISLLLFVLMASCSSHAKINPGKNKKPPPSDSTSGPTFMNPLLTNGPDPWVIRRNGFYYQMNTLGNRIGIRKVKYMANLGKAQLVTVWRPPAKGPNAKNIWAPELHYIKGNWFLYYTASPSGGGTHHIFVLEDPSKYPLKGTWVNKGKIADPNADYFAIDATVFKYHGSHYLLWSGHASPSDNTQRIYIAKMKNPWTLASPRVMISSPTYKWEQVGAPPKVDEGPEILKSPKGRVFLIFSASGCWTDDYKLGMMSLKKGSDPLKASNWVKKPNPIFTKDPAHHAYGPGHNGFFKSPDGTQYWIIYHANPNPGQGCGSHRSTRIQQFHWNKDGTPNFGRPVQLHVFLQVPSRDDTTGAH